MSRTFTISGSFPRRESLVKASWNFDKGLLTRAQLDAEYRAAAKELVDLQARLATEGVTDGNLAWHDAFRGLVEENPAFEVGGVVRLFETNKFYRQPVLKEAPRSDPRALKRQTLLEAVAPRRKDKKAVLPGPYWFLRAAKVESRNGSLDASHLIARYLNDVARTLEGLGYATLQFNEPLLFYERSPDLALARALLEATLHGLKARTIVNFPNGNAASHAEWAARLPADAIGLDFVETHVDDLPRKAKFAHLLAAVVDSQESLLETHDEVEQLAARIETRLAPKRLVLTHTWDLEFLPAPVAQRKLELLATVATGRKVFA